MLIVCLYFVRSFVVISLGSSYFKRYILGRQSMKSEPKNRNIINKALYLSVVIAFLIVLGAFLVLSGNKNIGFTVLGSSIVGIIVFWLFFIPQAQRIEISNTGITFYAYKYCRPYFWYQFRNIELKEGIDRQKKKTQQIVAEIYNTSPNKNHGDNSSYFELPINAEVYGYAPKELYEILREKIANEKLKKTDNKQK